mmetsp:Transcript_6173/g.14817  ORF Transcript_6173/g.14817 Transcript_6173/m.14817 type:complete len:430 (+) Transcript_6173:121-1410(+)
MPPTGRCRYQRFTSREQMGPFFIVIEPKSNVLDDVINADVVQEAIGGRNGKHLNVSLHDLGWSCQALLLTVLRYRTGLFFATTITLYQLIQIHNIYQGIGNNADVTGSPVADTSAHCQSILAARDGISVHNSARTARLGRQSHPPSHPFYPLALLRQMRLVLASNVHHLGLLRGLAVGGNDRSRIARIGNVGLVVELQHDRRRAAARDVLRSVASRAVHLHKRFEQNLLHFVGIVYNRLALVAATATAQLGGQVVRQVRHREVADVLPAASVSVEDAHDTTPRLAHVGRYEEGSVLIHLVVHLTALVADEGESGVIVAAGRSQDGQGLLRRGGVHGGRIVGGGRGRSLMQGPNTFQCLLGMRIEGDVPRQQGTTVRRTFSDRGDGRRGRVHPLVRPVVGLESGVRCVRCVVGCYRLGGGFLLLLLLLLV